MLAQKCDIRVALLTPDVPQNTGSILRTAACLGVGVDVIEPAGFRLDDRALRRAGLDYLEHAALTRHVGLDRFQEARASGRRRLVLVETTGAVPYFDFAFAEGDTLLFGSESAGTPADVAALADASVKIPMLAGRRSINLAVSVGIVLAEALRRTGGFPPATMDP